MDRIKFLKLIFTFSTFIICFSACKTNRSEIKSCGKFKYGEFILTNLETNNTYSIKRHNTYQLETQINSDNQESTYLNIKWINDCKYILIKDSVKNKLDNIDKLINKNGGLINTITSIENNCAFIETEFLEYKTKTKLCEK